MVIGEIVRNPNERLRIMVEEFKGNTFIDLRIYYLADDETWKPTRKGTTMKAEAIDEVVRLLKEAQAHAQEHQ